MSLFSVPTLFLLWSEGASKIVFAWPLYLCLDSMPFDFKAVRVRVIIFFFMALALAGARFTPRMIAIIASHHVIDAFIRLNINICFQHTSTTYCYVVQMLFFFVPCLSCVGEDFDQGHADFNELRRRDPVRMEGLDVFSNIL